MQACKSSSSTATKKAPTDDFGSLTSPPPIRRMKKRMRDKQEKESQFDQMVSLVKESASQFVSQRPSTSIHDQEAKVSSPGSTILHTECLESNGVNSNRKPWPWQWNLHPQSPHNQTHRGKEHRVVVKVGQHGGHLYTTTLFKSERGYYIMNHNAHGKDLTQNIMYSKVIR